MTTLTEPRNLKRQFDWERMSAWVAAIGVFFMFWQSMRDIHKDVNELRKEISHEISELRKDISGLSDRITRLEIKTEEKK